MYYASNLNVLLALLERYELEAKLPQAIQFFYEPEEKLKSISNKKCFIDNLSCLIFVGNDSDSNAAIAKALELIDGDKELIKELDNHIFYLNEIEQRFFICNFIYHSREYLSSEQNHFFHGYLLKFLLNKNPNTFKDEIIMACKKTIQNTQVDINLRINSIVVVLNYLNRWTLFGTCKSEKEIYNDVAKFIKHQAALEPVIYNYSDILPAGILTPKVGAMTYVYNVQKVNNDTGYIVIDIDKLQAEEYARKPKMQ